MIKLSQLGYFEPYRLTQKAIAPEYSNKRSKHAAYMILAPTAAAESQWLSESSSIQFRSVSKYFIPKRYTFQLYRKGNTILTPNSENEFDPYFGKGKPLSTIDGITSYLITGGSSSSLRDQNLLLELSFITEAVLNNPKDTRLPRMKAQELFQQLVAYMNKAFVTDPFLGPNYMSRTLFIPTSLWFTVDEYRNPDLIFKKANKNIMAQLLQIVSSSTNLQKIPADIILVDSNILMKMNSSQVVPDKNETADEVIESAIREYITRCYRSRSHTELSTDQKTPKEQKAEEEVAAAAKETEKEEKVDHILQSAKIDPDTVSEETKDKIKETIDTNAPNASADSSQENANLDVIYRAKMEGKSIASQKRNEMLKEKYKELKIGTVPISDFVAAEEKYEITPIQNHAHTINQAMKKNTSHELEKAYNDNLAQYDLVNILLHFSRINPPLYLNKDIKVTDASTPTDRLIRYEVSFEDEDRGRHNIKFLMPKMYKDKYMYLNDMELNISHQKFPYPITKTAPDRVQLVTNYNKLFSERYGSNLSPRITKIKKILQLGNLSKISVERGDATILNQMEFTTVEYDDLASNFIKIQIMQPNGYILTLYLIASDAKASVMASAPKTVEQSTIDADGNQTKIQVEDTSLLPFGVSAKRGSRENRTYYFISGKTNQVYDQNGTNYGEFSDFIATSMINSDPKLEEQFKTTSAGTRFVYSRTKIMGEWLPTVLVAAAADPGGLPAVLNKGKINTSFTEKRPSVDINTTGIIRFSNGYLSFDRYPYENSLLMNGLLVLPTQEYMYEEFMERDTYVELLDIVAGRRTLIDGIRNFYYLMVDPITKDVLTRLRMPTDFTLLLLYCVGTLADNTFQIDSNYANSRVRSNEIINVYLYKALTTAWEQWSSGRAEKFSIRENAVIKALMEVQIVDPHSKLNVTLEAENDSLIKLKGPSGMNEDHSFTLEKRAYHPSMTGIVAMNSTPSGEVGIGRHLSMNANIDDARGFITIDKKDYDGTELMSVGEMLQPFAAEASDIERVAMAISQAKHLVPVEHQTSNLISYDMDRVVPYISNDFAFRAKKDGKVVKLERGVIMIVQYSDGTYDDIDLRAHPDKNIDGGFYIMNQIKPLVNEGSRFKADEIIAADPKYINTNDMFQDPTANVGILARVAFVANGGVYEDSGYITDGFAHRAATRITRQKRVILSNFANIKYMVNVGQDIGVNEPLMTFDDTKDEFSSQLLQTIAADQTEEDEIVATNTPILSNVTGTVTDIMIYYTVDLDDMTPSLRKIVEAYNTRHNKEKKILEKYRNPSDANTILRPTDKLIPDGLGKVKGVEIGDGVIIDFYIEYLDIMAPGDKSSTSALKCTQSFIIPQEYAPYTDFNPDRPIDACISTIGMYKRMCLDTFKVGGLTKFLVEMKRIHKEKYLDRIKNELKKLK